MNIQLQPEYIFSLKGFWITNTFFTSILVSLFLIVLALNFRFFKRNIFIKGLEFLIIELLKFSDWVTGNRKFSYQVLPLIATFFLFIVTANLFALFPGFLGAFFVKIDGRQLPLLRSPNSDLTTTLALAIFSVGSIQYFSLKKLGFWKFIKRFINLTNPLKFILGFFEIISEGTKLLSFSFRLFGNIFAGEILLLVIGFLLPYFIPLPFMILEIFVGIIQAFIFSALTLTFIKGAIIRFESEK